MTESTEKQKLKNVIGWTSRLDLGCRGVQNGLDLILSFWVELKS